MRSVVFTNAPTPRGALPPVWGTPRGARRNTSRKKSEREAQTILPKAQTANSCMPRERERVRYGFTLSYDNHTIRRQHRQAAEITTLL